ncbi:MAG TPA: DUF1080 domain-containing protein [Candidatus Acidoferrum sp.]|nr:DUF1080 domain-containing protein [Candidatus Acidoferrum sp.]
MKLSRIVNAMTLASLLIGAQASAQSGNPPPKSSPPSSESEKAFLGRWDLTLKAPDREYPSWLELRREGGQLKADMVGRWGNSRPLPKAELSNGKLTFVSPKDEEAAPADMVFEGTLVGKILSGTVNGPDGKAWQWAGRRAPALKPGGEPKWGKPIPLFNGKDLSGWKMKGPGTTVWKVENGNLITPGNGPELINDSKFENFKLHVEFKADANSNSGVYLRGRYEVQVETDSAEEPPSHHTGGVYGFLAPVPELPRKAGEWQSFDITLNGRWITVVQNGQTVIDHKEIPGITGGALDSREELPGPIYLQGSEKGHVAYRSIVITPAEK